MMKRNDGFAAQGVRSFHLGALPRAGSRLLGLGGLAALLAWAPLAQAATDAVLDRIQQTGVLRVAYNPVNKPFSFPLDAGGASGYSVDLCERVAERLRTELGARQLRVEYRQITPAERIPLLKAGQVDIECGASTNTVERQRDVGFSLTIFVASARMLARAGSGIEDYKDLSKDKRIVVLKGTTGQQGLAARLSNLLLTPHIIVVNTEGEAARLLDEGQADAYVNDDVLLYGLRTKLKQPQNWSVTGKVLTIEPYGLMLPKGAPAFEAAVDRVLRDLYANGEIQRIYARWFDSREFSMPMNNLTKESYRWPNKTGAANSF